MTYDAAPGYLSADDCRLADLIDLVSQKTDLADTRTPLRSSRTC